MIIAIAEGKIIAKVTDIDMAKTIAIGEIKTIGKAKAEGKIVAKVIADYKIIA